MLNPYKDELATKETVKALEAATEILARNGSPDPNSFLVVEVAKLWVAVRGAV